MSKVRQRAGFALRAVAAAAPAATCGAVPCTAAPAVAHTQPSARTHAAAPMLPRRLICALQRRYSYSLRLTRRGRVGFPTAGLLPDFATIPPCRLPDGRRDSIFRLKSRTFIMLTNLRVWLNHFEYHAEQPRGASRDSLGALRPEERRLIARSIATFQLGEQSDGSGLLRAACRFAAAHGDELLPRITELFIREEQRHARLLREFMEEHGIRAKCRHWTDGVFRRLRRLAGFELYLHVLIAAELIGNVYYHALESVTGCQRLRVLCRTLISDELAHIGYESELILELRARKPAALRTLIRLLHRA